MRPPRSQRRPIHASKLAIEGGEKAVKTPPGHAPRWGEPERRQLEAMLRQNSLFYWQGPQTRLLTERFQTVCPLKYVQTCSSGTAALHIAVGAAGIGLGDEVITSPVTDIGSVIGVLYQQGVPVFADLGRGTYNLDVEDVKRRITPRTKAIIAVHLTGNPCDLFALKALADEHKLILIEDCAQAWGAKYRGKPIGSVGHIACFSLQDSKHITCGDGGVVASSDERFGKLLQRFRRQGRRPPQLGRRAGLRHELPHERAAGRRRRRAVAAAGRHRLAPRTAGQLAHGKDRQTARHHSARGTP